jgi:CelD/BcsL family acetyltransferase involved in cellulose biosynthesis
VIQLERVSIDDPRWRQFVDAAPDSTIFHRAEWVSVLAQTYRFRAFAVIATEGSTAVAGAPFLAVGGPFRRRWSSLPFTDACAPLGSAPAVSAFVGELERFAIKNGISSVEVRADHRSRPANSASVAVRHVLALDRKAGATLRGVAPAHARNARHAERAGVQIAVGNALSDVEAFYGLHVRTRRRLGVPVQPWRFFRLLGERIIAPGHGFVLTARRAGRPLGAAIFLASGETLVYKYGASDEREWAHRPNDLLFWTAIGAACQDGYGNLDFGRSDIADAGLRRFKSSWGARESALNYTFLGAAQKTGGTRVRNALAPLIRHSAPLVCRALGEALYRYSA